MATSEQRARPRKAATPAAAKAAPVKKTAASAKSATAKSVATKKTVAAKKVIAAKKVVTAGKAVPAKKATATKKTAVAGKVAATKKAAPAKKAAAPRSAKKTTAKPAAAPRARTKSKVLDPFERLRALVREALDNLKANDVAEIDVRGKSSVADLLVVASGTSTRHVKSLAEEVVRKAKQAGQPPIGVEGEREAEWVLVDLGDVIVHVMLPRTREFYGLERLWSVGHGNEVAA